VYYTLVTSYLWLLVGIIVLGFFSYMALLWAILEVLYSVVSVCEERELCDISRCGRDYVTKPFTKVLVHRKSQNIALKQRYYDHYFYSFLGTIAPLWGTC
jgi:hypothetical protein